MKRHEVFLKAIEKWGCRSQYEMAQEEAIELALAVRKHIRMNTKETFSHLAEEIADVKIMIEQMELMNPTLNWAVDEFMKSKIERLERRVTENNFEGS
ncbi:hypothetical protein V2E39_17170 [Chryseobacterium arthrosphaerae]|uniref:Uncharacterized protein n=1 Tax=Chryseobacterium arthrosphaerae TaxID=651561 RepID=A0ABU7R3C1_9FLAO